MVVSSQVQESQVWQLVKLISTWARHGAKHKNSESESLLDSYQFGLGMLTSLRVLGLAARRIYIHLSSTRNNA